MKFKFAQDGQFTMDGHPRPAYGFVKDDVFIVDPFRSENSIDEVDPVTYYGVPLNEARRLVECNRRLLET